MEGLARHHTASEWQKLVTLPQTRTVELGVQAPKSCTWYLEASARGHGRLGLGPETTEGQRF